MPPEPGGWHCRRTSTLPGFAIILPQLPKAILALPRLEGGAIRGRSPPEPRQAVTPPGRATSTRAAVVVAPQALARGWRERKSAGASRKRTVPAEDAEQRARKAERQRRYRERQKAKANGARARAERPGSGDARQEARGASLAIDDPAPVDHRGDIARAQPQPTVCSRRAVLNVEPVERPFHSRLADDPHSDPAYLRPPPLGIEAIDAASG
jgi:hypothetical protein